MEYCPIPARYFVLRAMTHTDFWYASERGGGGGGRGSFMNY